MPEALKRCPFCLNAIEPDLRTWDIPIGKTCVAVGCPTCGCRGPSYYVEYEPEAITAWNTRTTDPEIARLQDLVAKFQRGGVSTLFAEGNVE